MTGQDMLRRLFELHQENGTAVMIDKYERCKDFGQVLDLAVDLPVPFTCNGDYCGSLVEAANRKDFLERYDFLYESGWGYGAWEAFVSFGEIELDKEKDEYQEFIREVESLYNYPLLCDETHSNMKFELLEEWLEDEVSFWTWWDEATEGILEALDCEWTDEQWDRLVVQCTKLGKELDHFNPSGLVEDVRETIYDKCLACYEHNSVWVDLDEVKRDRFDNFTLEQCEWFVRYVAPAFALVADEIPIHDRGADHSLDPDSLYWKEGLMICGARCKYCGGKIEWTTASCVENKSIYSRVNVNQLSCDCPQATLKGIVQ